MKEDDEGAYYAPNPDVYGKRHGNDTDKWRIMPPCTLPCGRQVEGRAKLIKRGALDKPKQGKDAPKPWEHDAWRIVLKILVPHRAIDYIPAFYAIDYRTGTGHRVEVRRDYGTVRRDSVPNAPEVWAVVNSLCSDASCAHGNTFEDFCAEMGGDTDSISSRETYLACVDIAARLPRFLGVPADKLVELGQTLDEQACERARAEREAAK